MSTSTTTLQPSPATTTNWQSLLMLCSADESLPMRTAYLDASFRWYGDRIQLVLTDLMSRTGEGNDFHGTGRHVARFELVGDGAAFLNAISADADATWERDERNWLEKPQVHCPKCECKWPKRDRCTNCRRTGWVLLSPDDAQHNFDRRWRKRQEQIDAAIAADK